ncbi:sigma factor-like helix-turn-helix DNA-binding protein [Desulfitobacterium sp.]|uniref:sigma factor-like helix-turn-helix DNA-binding protein n=1 Tax=Desulfitobacterium sp. TaxID=49981 RepID=UPI003A5220CF
MYTREQVVNAIENCLNKNEREIIMIRFGIEDGITTSLNEIESRFGISREQVREIEKKVLIYIGEHC